MTVMPMLEPDKRWKGSWPRRRQEEYAQLHDKYQAIKAQRISEVEAMLGEQTKQARGL